MFFLPKQNKNLNFFAAKQHTQTGKKLHLSRRETMLLPRTKHEWRNKTREQRM
jgi:hypothetical protein